MKQTHHKPQKLHDLIFEHLFGDYKAVISKKDVKDRLEYFLCMMTKKQKTCVLKKLNRCDNYINLISRGMDASRVKSIIKRKHQIQRQYINEACAPCVLYLKNK